MSDVFAELDEVMRQEKLAKFWRENGTALIIFVVMTVLVTAGISAYKAWDVKVRKTQTQELLSLMDTPDFPANLDLKALNLRPGLETIATLQAAGVLMKEGKQQDALPLYTSLAGDKSAPREFRDLAILMAARLRAAEANTPEEVAGLYESLSQVANNEKTPWRYHAHLDMAVLLADKQQNFEEARTHLAAVIKAEGLPTSLVSKAQALDHVYSLKHDKIKGE